jgi:molybdopterin synthase sulfur carrier subunit
MAGMELQLRFFATFREAVGQKTLEHDFPDGSTVGEVLRTLESEYNGLEGQLLDDHGELQPNLNILKNGREVLHMDGPDTLMEDGDTLSIFPPVAGGR